MRFSGMTGSIEDCSFKKWSLEGWLAWIETCHVAEIDLGLERVNSVFRELSLFAEKAPIIFTIAGTNGKGSTSTYIESILLSEGYSVGVYSSPHIEKYNERIRVGGRPVDDDEICRSFSVIKELIDNNNSLQTPNPITLTYFEYSTLAALEIFSKKILDVVILEVGLGGRLDAVNIIDPDCAVITNISLDHQDWLGDTREDIGFEKAGIMRRGVPVVFGDEDIPASVMSFAKEVGAELYLLGMDFTFAEFEDSWEFDFEDIQIKELPKPLMYGRYQLKNAATAITSIFLLKEMLPISNKSIIEGLKKAFLPGRTELYNDDNIWILDVSHNSASVKNLVEFIKDQYPKKIVSAIFGLLKRKSMSDVIDQMVDVVDNWFFISADDVQGYSTIKLREYLSKKVTNSGETCLRECESIKEAIELSRTASGEGDIIVVFGSFSVIEKFRNSIS